jgi:hypothetical protein
VGFRPDGRSPCRQSWRSALPQPQRAAPRGRPIGYPALFKTGLLPGDADSERGGTVKRFGFSPSDTSAASHSSFGTRSRAVSSLRSHMAQLAYLRPGVPSVGNFEIS